MPVRRGLNDIVKAAKRQKDPLSKLIDRYFAERKEDLPFAFQPKPHVRRGGRFTPSSCGSPKHCQRAGVLSFMQVRKQRITDAELELVFLVGDYTHLLWFNIFCHMEKVLGKETFQVLEIEHLVGYPSLYLAGWLDILVRIEGRLYIVDFKTINDRGFSKLLRERKPDEGYVGQLVRYLHCRKIPRGIILYLNKDNQQWKGFVVRAKLQADVWNYTKSWIREAIGYMKRQEIPPRHKDCTAGSAMAKSCGFAYLCYGDGAPTQLRDAAYTHGKSYKQLWKETTAEELN